MGDSVTTTDKLVGEVSSVNVLRQRVKVLITHDNDEKELKEYPVEELRLREKEDLIRSALMMIRNLRHLKN